MKTVEINLNQVSRIAGGIPMDRAIVMINLLKFREIADYGANKEFEPCSGREAFYKRYHYVGLKYILEDGAKILWRGKILGRVVGPPGEIWDDAIIVQYPSYASLQNLFEKPEFAKIAIHRTAALDDSRLLAAMADTMPVSLPIC